MPATVQATVLDAWPIVAAYQRYEPARSTLNRLLEDPAQRPIISAVNFAEVCYALARHTSPTDAAGIADYLRVALDVEETGTATAQAAGWIKHTYRVPLGDAFAAATALEHGSDLWTGDPDLLCSDRIWGAHDVRAPQDRTVAGPRRRPTAAGLADAEIVSLITAPLRAAAPPAHEGPDLGIS